MVGRELVGEGGRRRAGCEATMSNNNVYRPSVREGGLYGHATGREGDIPAVHPMHGPH